MVRMGPSGTCVNIIPLDYYVGICKYLETCTIERFLSPKSAIFLIFLQTSNLLEWEKLNSSKQAGCVDADRNRVPFLSVIP